MLINIPTKKPFNKIFKQTVPYDEMKYILQRKDPFSFFSQKFKVSGCDFDELWLANACDYIQKLDKKSKTVLFAYSSPEYQVINAFKAGVKDVAESLVWKNEPPKPERVYELMKEPSLRQKVFNGDLTDLIKLRLKCTKYSKKAKEIFFKTYDEFIAAVKLRPMSFYKPAFFKESYVLDLKSSAAPVFYYQFCDVLGKCTLSEYYAKIARITESQWNKILNKFVSDLDKIITECPVIPKPMTVFRGSHGKKIRLMKTYTSTTLSRDIAKSFAGKECCIHEIRLPSGSHALPMMSISRHPEELEIIILPDARYVKHTTMV
jgi:hypothetical protein